jgi:hypothetical protein
MKITKDVYKHESRLQETGEICPVTPEQEQREDGDD